MFKDRFSQDELETLLKDAEWETAWREEADRAAAYYDGHQLSPDVLRLMDERGLAPLIRNLIGPTIDLVLGIEAKAKRDWKVRADTDESVDVAEAMSAELKKAERSSSADRACSDAYASAVKSGVGWVEVAREANPFRAPYRVAMVHRREVFWDFRAREPDLSDARYLVRKRWIDEDIAVLHFPKKAELIRKAINRWADWDDQSTGSSFLDLADSYSRERLSQLDDTEWRDVDRKRICLYEVWYRYWRAAPVMTLPSGQTTEYDEKNPAHVRAVALGMVQVRKAVFPKVRLAWWAGPHALADIPSPYPHGHFPYVPFWAYREDVTGAPYGLIRRMMSPQDEVNTRLSKMMWLLSAKRVIGDSDALDMPWTEAVEEASRPDSVILLNPNRKNKIPDAVRIESDFQLSQQQYQVLVNATSAIQDAAGVYQSMLGKSDYSGQSGLAISNLVEQGSTTLAELNDNHRFARKHTGTLLLSLVKEDIGRAPYKVTIDSNGARRVVLLNQPSKDADGWEYLTNDVAQTAMSVELDDVPDTPSYRSQQLMMMTEITKSLPPDLQPLLADFMVRATDLPFRHEVADRISKAMGFGNSQGDSGDPATAQIQQQQMQMQLAEQQARVQKAQLEAQAVAEKVQATRMDAAMKAQMAQQKLVITDDQHAASMDEQMLRAVQQAQQSEDTRRLQAQSAEFRQRQQDEIHRARLQSAARRFTTPDSKNKQLRS